MEQSFSLMEYNKGICFLISNKVMNKIIFSRILYVVLLLLCIPFFAMQFNGSVHWSLGDFILMGLLLMGLGISIKLILNLVSDINYNKMIDLSLEIAKGFFLNSSLNFNLL